MMEQRGSEPSVIMANIHTQHTFDLNGHIGDGDKTLTIPDSSTAFHLYQLNWTPTGLDIGVDGIMVKSFAKNGTSKALWPFDSGHHLILNLAVGGEMGGVIDDAIFPAEILIDYVRVYQ